MTMIHHWNSFAGRLGTSPKQLALLLASAAGAIGIFGVKLVVSPASASAQPSAAVAAPTAATPNNSNAASAPLPASYLAAAPRWNLPARPSRNPFEAPDDMPHARGNELAAGATNEPTGSGIDLQATLDRQFAVVNGKTVSIGQNWTDSKSGRTYRLVEVFERSARFASGDRLFDIQLDG